MWAKVLVCTCGALLAWNASAQGAMGAEDMVRHLQGAPKTRSLGRNLVVSPASPETAEPPAGALSLSVQFDFDSHRVKGESLPLIDNLSAAMRSSELSSARFRIEGHTDAKGRADYNLKLSELRATAVKDMLVQRGVSPDRLVAVGKGSTEPADPIHPLAATNRRVRVVNLQ